MEMRHKIVVCPAGGLANRMRALMSGITLARDTDRDVEIVWMRDDGLNAGYEDLFDIKCLPVKLMEPGYAEFALKYSLPRKKNLYLSRIYQSFRFERCFFDVPANLPLYESKTKLAEAVRSHDGDLYFVSGYDFYCCDPEEYRRVLKPSADIIGRLDRLKADVGDCKVGLHIRRTDNTTSIEMSPLELFKEKIEREIAADDTVRFYLATDDEQVKAELMQSYPGRIFCLPRKASRDTLEGMKDAMVELLMLAGMRQVYGSHYSSYSEAAAIIGCNDFETCRI